MNCIIPLHKLPTHMTSEKPYKQKTSSRPTPEYRVKALLSFPFSNLIRQHTIQELLNDPETAGIVKRLLNK